MKKNSLIAIIFFCLQLLSAQEIEEISTEMDSINKSSTNIPIKIIEEVPVFPGCENLNLEDRKYCLNKKMQMHVARKFNSSITNTLGLAEGKYKIYVLFKINEFGFVDSLKVRAPHPALKVEAIRVAQELPKMIPGKLNGENVSVKYTLPITFYVDKPKRKRKNRN